MIKLSDNDAAKIKTALQSSKAILDQIQEAGTANVSIELKEIEAALAVIRPVSQLYYILAEFDGGAWSPQFGDYVRGTVEDERLDRMQSMPRGYGKRLLVVKTGDAKEIINLTIQTLNAPLGLCEHGPEIDWRNPI